MPTTVKENYLKALFFLDQESSKISVTELSKRLEVSKPTASNMMKSLQEKDWVIYQKYKPLQLTPKGKKIAAKVIRKHRLTEMFLFKIMGFGWEEVHEIAEEMEHLNSEKLFNRMDEMLNHPTVDPHGSPIPDRNGKVIKQKLTLLADVKPGLRVELVALAKSSKSLLTYLNDCNIELGVQIELIKTEPFDKSCLIKLNDDTPFVVSHKVAKSLLVKEK